MRGASDAALRIGIDGLRGFGIEIPEAFGPRELRIAQERPIDLAQVVRENVQRFEEDLARAGSSIAIRAEAPVIGQWDPLGLEQIVVNLLSNAIKFGTGKPIEITVERDAGLARLVVRDHGTGIAPDRVPHIFERFERGVSTRQYGGLGLGLYIVKGIVDALGGAIHVESKLDEGSSFTVELPPAGRPRRPRPSDPPRLHDKHHDR
jgi:signal transduction histidine kinase